jgi:hypothetical protein
MPGLQTLQREALRLQRFRLRKLRRDSPQGRSRLAANPARRERFRVLPGGERLAFGSPQMGSSPPSGSTATRHQRLRILTHQSAVNRMRLLCSSCFTHVLQAQCELLGSKELVERMVWETLNGGRQSHVG